MIDNTNNNKFKKLVNKQTFNESRANDSRSELNMNINTNEHRNLLVKEYPSRTMNKFHSPSLIPPTLGGIIDNINNNNSNNPLIKPKAREHHSFSSTNNHSDIFSNKGVDAATNTSIIMPIIPNTANKLKSFKSTRGDNINSGIETLHQLLDPNGSGPSGHSQKRLVDCISRETNRKFYNKRGYHARSKVKDINLTTVTTSGNNEVTTENDNNKDDDDDAGGVGGILVETTGKTKTQAVINHHEGTRENDPRDIQGSPSSSSRIIHDQNVIPLNYDYDLIDKVLTSRNNLGIKGVKTRALSRNDCIRSTNTTFRQRERIPETRPNPYPYPYPHHHHHHYSYLNNISSSSKDDSLGIPLIDADKNNLSSDNILYSGYNPYGASSEKEISPLLDNNTSSRNVSQYLSYLPLSQSKGADSFKMNINRLTKRRLANNSTNIDWSTGNPARANFEKFLRRYGIKHPDEGGVPIGIGIKQVIGDDNERLVNASSKGITTALGRKRILKNLDSNGSGGVGGEEEINAESNAMVRNMMKKVMDRISHTRIIGSSFIAKKPIQESNESSSKANPHDLIGLSGMGSNPDDNNDDDKDNGGDDEGNAEDDSLNNEQDKDHTNMIEMMDTSSKIPIQTDPTLLISSHKKSMPSGMKSLNFAEAYVQSQINTQPFIELKRNPNNHYEYLHSEINKETELYMTRKGIIEIADNTNRTTQVIHNRDYITEKMQYRLIYDLPVFRRFKTYKWLKLWYRYTKRNIYELNRQKLYDNLIISHPVFLKHFNRQNEMISTIETIQYIGIKEKYLYTFHDNNNTLETQQVKKSTKLNKKMEEIHHEYIKYIDQVQNDVKDYIDMVQNTINNNIIESLTYIYLHSKEHYSKIIKNDLLKSQIHSEINKILRLSDNFYRLLLYKLVSTLIKIIISNEQYTQLCFFKGKASPSFEVRYILDLNVNDYEHHPTLHTLSDYINGIIAKSKRELLQNVFLTKIFEHLQNKYKYNIRVHNTNLEHYICDTVETITRNQNQVKIFEKIRDSYDLMLKDLDVFRQFLEISQYYKDFMFESRSVWPFQIPKARAITAHLKKIDHFNLKLMRIPSTNITYGDCIQLHTNNLLKQYQGYISEMINEIRTNCLEYLEDELRDFKYDLLYKIQTIEIIPKNVEEYVEQIKGIEMFIENRAEFEAKYNQFEDLMDMLKFNKIYINQSFHALMNEIKVMFDRIPPLLELTISRVIENKDEIDESLTISFLSLIDKIKDFKKRYIQEYLKDEDKFANPEKTLDDLIIRTIAIDEIGKLVHQYKDFDTQEHIDKIKKKGFIPRKAKLNEESNGNGGDTDPHETSDNSALIKGKVKDKDRHKAHGNNGDGSMLESRVLKKEEGTKMLTEEEDESMEQQQRLDSRQAQEEMKSSTSIASPMKQYHDANSGRGRNSSGGGGRKAKPKRVITIADRNEILVLYNEVLKAHKETIKLWKILAYWYNAIKKYMKVEFRVLDLNKIFHKMKKVKAFFDNELYKENDEFGKHLAFVRDIVLNEIDKLTKELHLLKPIKTSKMLRRHWQQIYKLLGLASQDFTLAELLNTNYVTHMNEIENIINQGEEEAKYEEVLKILFSIWDNEKLKYSKYRNIYLIDFDFIEYLKLKIEHYEIHIKQNLQKFDTNYLKEKIDDYFDSLDTVTKFLDYMHTLQTLYLNIEIIDEYIKASKNKKYQNQNNKKKMMKKNNDNEIFANLTDSQIEKIINTFDKFHKYLANIYERDNLLKEINSKNIVKEISIIQDLTTNLNEIKSYINQALKLKRAAYPRFMLLDDNTLINLINEFYLADDCSNWLKLVFPGIFKLKIHTEYLAITGKRGDIEGSIVKKANDQGRIDDDEQGGGSDDLGKGSDEQARGNDGLGSGGGGGDGPRSGSDGPRSGNNGPRSGSDSQGRGSDDQARGNDDPGRGGNDQARINDGQGRGNDDQTRINDDPGLGGNDRARVNNGPVHTPNNPSYTIDPSNYHSSSNTHNQSPTNILGIQSKKTLKDLQVYDIQDLKTKTRIPTTASEKKPFEYTGPTSTSFDLEFNAQSTSIQQDYVIYQPQNRHNIHNHRTYVCQYDINNPNPYEPFPFKDIRLPNSPTKLKKYIELMKDKSIPEFRLYFQQAKQDINEDYKVYKISGIIDQTYEYFPFENPVYYTDEVNVENLFGSIEQEMKNSVSKKTIEAIMTFRTVNFDEWILDYPSQIIITAIHLIISNEIKDMYQTLEDYYLDGSHTKPTRLELTTCNHIASYDSANLKTRPEELNKTLLNLKTLTSALITRRDQMKAALSQIDFTACSRQKPGEEAGAGTRGSSLGGLAAAVGDGELSSEGLTKPQASSLLIPEMLRFPMMAIPQQCDPNMNQDLPSVKATPSKPLLSTSKMMMLKGNARGGASAGGSGGNGPSGPSGSGGPSSGGAGGGGLHEEEDLFEKERLKEKIELILNKPKIIPNKVIADPYEVVEVFGYNVDLKYMGFDKAETDALLRQKSFRGLYLRLLAWVNLIRKIVEGLSIGGDGSKASNPTNMSSTATGANNPNANSDDNKAKFQIKPSNKAIITKYNQILLFVIYLRDIILDIYENSNTRVSQYELDKHINLQYNVSTKALSVNCGGWSSYMGNEYLGNVYRMFISPLTERYFLFMSTALRQRSSVVFKTHQGHDTSYTGIIQEFANICSIASYNIYTTSSISTIFLLNTLNASAYGNLWLNFDHLHNLNLPKLSIFIKHVQFLQHQALIHELDTCHAKPSLQYQAAQVVAEGNMHNSQKGPQSNRELGSNGNGEGRGGQEGNRGGYESSRGGREGSLGKGFEHGFEGVFSPSTRYITLGIFASYTLSSTMINSKSISNIQADQAKLNVMSSAFRMMGLVMPDIETIVKNMLFVYGFKSYMILAMKIVEFLEKINEEMEEVWKKEGKLHFNPPLKFTMKYEDIYTILRLIQAYKDTTVLPSTSSSSTSTNPIPGTDDKAQPEAGGINLVNNNNTTMTTTTASSRDPNLDKPKTRQNSSSLTPQGVGSSSSSPFNPLGSSNPNGPGSSTSKGPGSSMLNGPGSNTLKGPGSSTLNGPGSSFPIGPSGTIGLEDQGGSIGLNGDIGHSYAYADIAFDLSNLMSLKQILGQVQATKKVKKEELTRFWKNNTENDWSVVEKVFVANALLDYVPMRIKGWLLLMTTKDKKDKPEEEKGKEVGLNEKDDISINTLRIMTISLLDKVFKLEDAIKETFEMREIKDVIKKQFAKHNLMNISDQIDSCYNLFLSLKHYGSAILLSEPFKGKTIIIEILFKCIEILYPMNKVQSIKVNPALLTNFTDPSVFYHDFNTIDAHGNNSNKSHDQEATKPSNNYPSSSLSPSSNHHDPIGLNSQIYTERLTLHSIDPDNTMRVAAAKDPTLTSHPNPTSTLNPALNPNPTPIPNSNPSNPNLSNPTSNPSNPTSNPSLNPSTPPLSNPFIPHPFSDNLTYILDKISSLNKNTDTNFIIFDGPITSSCFWDIFKSYYFSSSSCSYSSSLTLSSSTSGSSKPHFPQYNILGADDYTRIYSKCTRDYQGRVYHFENNIIPIIETTTSMINSIGIKALAHVSPGIIAKVGIVKMNNSNGNSNGMGLDDMMKLLQLKLQKFIENTNSSLGRKLEMKRTKGKTTKRSGGASGLGSNIANGRTKGGSGNASGDSGSARGGNSSARGSNAGGGTSGLGSSSGSSSARDGASGLGSVENRGNQQNNAMPSKITKNKEDIVIDSGYSYRRRLRKGYDCSTFLKTYLLSMIDRYQSEFPSACLLYNLRSLFYSFIKIFEQLLEMDDNVFEDNILAANTADTANTADMANVANMANATDMANAGKLTPNMSKLNISNVKSSEETSQKRSFGEKEGIGSQGQQAIQPKDDIIIEENDDEEGNHPLTNESLSNHPIIHTNTSNSDIMEEGELDEITQHLRLNGFVAFCWSFGIVLDHEGKIKFNELCRPYTKGFTNLNHNANIFDYYYDEDMQCFFKFMNRDSFSLISSSLPPSSSSIYEEIYASYNLLQSNNNVYIPTMQTLYVVYMLKSSILYRYGINLAIISQSNTGKSSLLSYIQPLLNDTHHVYSLYSMLIKEQSQFYQLILKNYMLSGGASVSTSASDTNSGGDGNSQRQYHTITGKPPLVVIDDVAMEPGYREINLLEFLRFWRLSNGVMDMTNNQFYELNTIETVYTVSTNKAKIAYARGEYSEDSQSDECSSNRFLFQSHKIYYNPLDDYGELETIYTKLIRPERHNMSQLSGAFTTKISKFQLGFLRYLYQTLANTQPNLITLPLLSSTLIQTLNDIVYYTQELEFNDLFDEEMNTICGITFTETIKNLKNLNIPSTKMPDIQRYAIHLLRSIFGNHFEADSTIIYAYPPLRKPVENRLIRSKSEYFNESYSNTELMLQRNSTLSTINIEDLTIIGVYSDIILDICKSLKTPKTHLSIMFNPGNHIKDILYFCALQSNTEIITNAFDLKEHQDIVQSFYKSLLWA